MSSWGFVSASKDAQDWDRADGFIEPQGRPEIRGSTIVVDGVCGLCLPQPGSPSSICISQNVQR